MKHCTVRGLCSVCLFHPVWKWSRNEQWGSDPRCSSVLDYLPWMCEILRSIPGGRESWDLSLGCVCLIHLGSSGTWGGVEGWFALSCFWCVTGSVLGLHSVPGLNPAFPHAKHELHYQPPQLEFIFCFQGSCLHARALIPKNTKTKVDLLPRSWFYTVKILKLEAGEPIHVHTWPIFVWFFFFSVPRIESRALYSKASSLLLSSTCGPQTLTLRSRTHLQRVFLKVRSCLPPKMTTILPKDHAGRKTQKWKPTAFS